MIWRQRIQVPELGFHVMVAVTSCAGAWIWGLSGSGVCVSPHARARAPARVRMREIVCMHVPVSVRVPCLCACACAVAACMCTCSMCIVLLIAAGSVTARLPVQNLAQMEEVDDLSMAASSSDSGEVDYLGGGQRRAAAKKRAHTPGRIAERPVEERRTHAYRMLAAKAQKNARNKTVNKMRCTRAHSKQIVCLVLCDAVFALAS